MSASGWRVFSIFQSTHPVRGATTALNSAKQAIAISIHAPREGCDTPIWVAPITLDDFNPRTP